MIEKRFEELNERAYERGYNTFSDFLNIEEQSVLKSTYLPCVLFADILWRSGLWQALAMI